MDDSFLFTDCNLPELLAVDLEQSKSVFHSRSLTSGTPEPSLSDTRSRRTLSLQDGTMDFIMPSRPRELLFEAKSGSSSGLQYSQLFALGDEFHQGQSDGESINSASSGCAEPQPIKTRNMSIDTPATSISSEKHVSPASDRPLVALPEVNSQSWMDLEDDDDAAALPGLPEAPGRRHSLSGLPLSSRHLSRCIDVDNLRTKSLVSRSPPSGPFAASPLPRSPEQNYYDAMETPAANVENEAWEYPAGVPLRSTDWSAWEGDDSSSHSHLDTQINRPPTPATLHPTYESESAVTSNPRDRINPKYQVTPTEPVHVAMKESSNREAPVKGRPRRARFEDNAETDSCRAEDPVTDKTSSAIDQLEIAPQPVNVDMWLESMLHGYAANPPQYGGEPSSRMPLPANVMESLRISVSCFPDTILTCGSLAVETVRARSRRNHFNKKFGASSKASPSLSPPGSAPVSNNRSLSHDPTTSGIPKSSTWRWVTSKKQQIMQGFSSGTNEQNLEDDFSGGSFPDMGAGMMQNGSRDPPAEPDWVSLKNIFPASTDYLCDALYAHLLVYNYITSLCPRSALFVGNRNRPQTHNNQNGVDAELLALMGTDNEDDSSDDGIGSESKRTRIPSKAATLLGLKEASRPTTMQSSTTAFDSQQRPGSSSRGAAVIHRMKSRALQEKKRLGLGMNGSSDPSAFSSSDDASASNAKSRLLGRHHKDKGTSKRISSEAPQKPAAPLYPMQIGVQNPEVTALLDLRRDLARCVARLVATLRLTTGAAGIVPEQPVAAASRKEEVDPLFLRALCEIVRSSEER